jgi:hypothetical protein
VSIILLSLEENRHRKETGQEATEILRTHCRLGYLQWITQAYDRRSIDIIRASHHAADPENVEAS